MRSGVLSPTESGKYIAENAKHVKIIDEGLEKMADEIISSMKDGKIVIPETKGDAIHPSKDHPRAADWVFVTDALNFCFWSYSGAKKWTVDGFTGYYALEAALRRAIKEERDITNPEYYSKITEEELRHILRGDNEAQIPLLEKRLQVLHDVGKKLIEKYNGSFENCIKIANKSALKLIDLVTQDFPCFDDIAEYKGKTVALYKRVQILVSDLQYFFGKEGLGDFDDIDSLTMFADYRVPQVMVHFGALAYTEELMDKLKNDILLTCGSEEEVEIRGCSIHAVELLKQKIAEKLKDAPDSWERPNSATIDYFLWCYRSKYADELEHIPFHKTFGIFY